MYCWHCRNALLCETIALVLASVHSILSISPVRPAIHPSIHTSIHPSAHPSIHPHPAVRPSVCPCVRASVRPSIRLYIHPFIHSSLPPSPPSIIHSAHSLPSTRHVCPSIFSFTSVHLTSGRRRPICLQWFVTNVRSCYSLRTMITQASCHVGPIHTPLPATVCWNALWAYHT